MACGHSEKLCVGSIHALQYLAVAGGAERPLAGLPALLALPWYRNEVIVTIDVGVGNHSRHFICQHITEERVPSTVLSLPNVTDVAVVVGATSASRTAVVSFDDGFFTCHQFISPA